ncbi:EAL domain-containing protein [Aliarcobacter butzleri]|uniref:bifunctional diguanylate cyclase/phosphodiesterase n=1 Tax=Aliarcobacter butzleri TaxID=28197 RepID=UPI00102DC4CF|nr:GGDEF domain-containing phosphodiesterase [Aliarcobacter butzleri]RZV14895.1 EAL domain-containing protein [Aliarcobacter butzleri]
MKRSFFAKWKELDEIKRLEKELEKQNILISQKREYIHKINEIIENSDVDKEKLLDTLFLLNEYKNAIDESSIVSKANNKGIITFVNDRFCEISGYKKEELIGKSHNIIRHPSMTKEFFKDMWNTLLNKEIFRGIITNKRKDGEPYYVDTTIIPIIDNDNNIIEFIGIRHDITEIFEKEKIIQKQFLDELTSLPNRQKLLNDLKSVINPKIAIINIDDFRNINDFYGFEIGDLVLKKFSDKLSQFKTKNLNIYRISSDIFVLLADKDFSLEKLKNISNFLIEDISKNPLYINHETFYLTLTIGVSSNINEKYNDNVLTKAEFAIYTAKNNNQNIFILDENIFIYKSLKNNKELVKNLKNALLKDNLLIFGQKIINNRTNKIKFEILMRIKLEDETILFPSSFLEVSKKAKFYLSMTKILVKKACEYFKDKNIEFSLNLTLEDLEDDYTINQIFKTIAKTNTAKQITFEIVESEQIENFEKINKFIKDAKSLGCKIAIDDFGTGYSNFSYIAKLNIDIIKIDGSLIKNIHIDKNIQITVSTIVNFAKALNIKTVAEYVHNKEVYECVKNLGIDYSQGYYLHKPEELTFE